MYLSNLTNLDVVHVHHVREHYITFAVRNWHVLSWNIL